MVTKRRNAYKVQTECPECKQSFKGTVGRATHMRKAHGLNPDSSKWIESKVAKPKAIVKHQHRKVVYVEKTEPVELFAYITAKLEGIIHRVAFEHDVPERQLAKGFAQYLRRP